MSLHAVSSPLPIAIARCILRAARLRARVQLRRNAGCTKGTENKPKSGSMFHEAGTALGVIGCFWLVLTSVESVHLHPSTQNIHESGTKNETLPLLPPHDDDAL
jgi:hypothetical protein